MLVDKTDGYLKEVIQFSKKIGMFTNLQKNIAYLSNYGRRNGHVKSVRFTLFRDFAPQSFVFDVEWDCGTGFNHIMNGGLIYHGSHDGYGSGQYPTLSVCLSPTDGWMVHT